jgi:hypothetical protein
VPLKNTVIPAKLQDCMYISKETAHEDAKLA